MAKIGVILSGCGVKDGAEIHESVLSMYFLDKYGFEYVVAAPDKDQSIVINHVTGQPSGERRNVLAEAARIARGDIVKLSSLTARDIDAALLPGGFGAAQNLSTFAKDGDNCVVDDDLSRLLKDLHSQGKPIAALCIAPAILAKLFGPDHKAKVTIGTDAGTAQALQKMGAQHENKAVDDIVYDEQNNLVTTPCYMLAMSIKEVGAGIEKTVRKLSELLNK